MAGVKVSPLLTGLAFLLSCNALPIQTAEAQSPDDKSTLIVSYGNGGRVRVRGRNGPFPTIGIGAGERVDLRVDLPARFANVPLVVQALDGGRVSPEVFAAGVGLVQARFQAGTQPGLYRLLISGGGQSAPIHFWVANPDDPAANPIVVTPQSQGGAQ